MKLVYFIPFLVFVFVPAFAYNSGFQPVYSPPLPPGGVANIHTIGNVTGVGCAIGQFLSVNASAIWACANGGAGEANTASSSGVGESLVLPKVGVDLPFKGISVSGDLVIGSNATDVTISYTDPAGGSGNATSLDELGDVIITSPAYLSTLFYNGVAWIDKIFTVNSVTCGAGQFVNIINNQTGATSCGTPSGSGNMTVLNDGGDVTITSPAPLSVLYYVGTQWIDKIFSVNTQSASNDIFITGINNQTGVITTKQFSVNSKTCSGTDKISAINNVTGEVTCTTDETGSGGTPRGGYLMAHWTMSQTKSNIGTSFIDVYSQTNSNGKAIFIDTDTFTTVRLHIQWNKVGTGTQTCQVITGATVLVSMNVVSGSNDSGFVAIPGGLLNAENAFRIQCKSITSTDDPIFESASIWLK